MAEKIENMSDIKEHTIETDLLIVGGGIAGLVAAIRAKQLGVENITLVDKAYSGKSGASCFCGGSIGVDNPEWDDQAEMDRRKKHWVRWGEYITNQDWFDTIFKDSWARLQELRSWGVPFCSNYGEDLPEGKWDPARYADGWYLEGTLVRMRKRNITPPLREKALKDGITILDRIMVTDLLMRAGRVVGAVGFHARDGDFYKFAAKATILAAGCSGLKHIGNGRDYRTGEAEMMAYRAGAELTSRELGGHGGFGIVQQPAGRGDQGGIGNIRHWNNAEGDTNWPERYGQVGPVHTGHRKCSAWAWEVDAGRGPIYWDLDQATDAEIEKVFGMFKRQKSDLLYRKWGHDLWKRGKVEYVETNNIGNADKGQGGIKVKHPTCETALPGLYAAGDSAGTMFMGAEFPGMGIGTLHATVTGYHAGESAANYSLKARKAIIDEEQTRMWKEAIYRPILRKGGFPHIWVTQCIQSVSVPYYMFAVKSAERLEAALTMCKFIQERIVPKLKAKDIHELRMCNEVRNMALNHEVMIRSSLFRTESRGMHYREDYPRRVDPDWLAWTVVKKDENDDMMVYKEPIPKEWWPDLSKPYEEIYDWRHPRDNTLPI